ncbi:13821_t:CDS:1, partial [Racocetra fulgida]
MKPVRIVDIFVIVCAVLFIVEQVNSCEKDCQNGISKAFADNWADEVKPIYGDFQNNTLDHLFYGISSEKVSDNSTLEKDLTTDVRNSVSDQIESITKTFISGMAGIIKNAIFNEEPKMKGDCNNTVTQPPLGVNWTREDCVKMDRICGNPPSICHFLDLNKDKCFSDLKANVENSTKAGGDYINQIKKTVTDVVSKYSLTTTGSDYFMGKVLKNVQNTLNGLNGLGGLNAKFKTDFCSNNCTQFD